VSPHRAAPHPPPEPPLPPGTGQAAALLAHRLGDQHVTNVEIDPDLHPLARRRLDALGISPILRLGDSAHPGVRRR
jgi:protein-L-isoaspartate O-methyltransferase